MPEPDPRLGVMLTFPEMNSGKKKYTRGDIRAALNGVAEQLAQKGPHDADYTHNLSGITIQVRTSGMK